MAASPAAYVGGATLAVVADNAGAADECGGSTDERSGGVDEGSEGEGTRSVD